MSLLKNIETEAKDLGFFFVKASLPQTPSHFHLYEEWLRNGFQGKMAYLESENARTRRRDPALIFPEVKTILSLAFCYPIPPTQEEPNGINSPAGDMASFSFGIDYHRWVPERLEILMTRIKHMAASPISYKILVDSAPLLEREMAQNAGLGWIGKNSCLIHPEIGSYFFLAEVMLDFFIEPSAPFEKDHCGQCSACIQACPAQCILPNRTIRAVNCISYLTVENRGVIPLASRDLIGSWVFGCDICQMVCPWNQLTAKKQPWRIQNKENLQVRLLDEIHLSPHEFKQKYAQSAIQRVKHAGFVRNLVVALGNSQDVEAIPHLQELLHNSHVPLVRGHAAWALGKIDPGKAYKPLQKAYQTETDPYVLEEIKQALQ
jgi:epoxyqueuosine reductase